MRRLLPLACIVLLGAACSIDSDPAPTVPASGKPAPSGPVYGTRPDGRVDVTAAQAWPSRIAEPAPLTPLEVARACVALGSCRDPSASPATLVGLCALPDAAEERAIPQHEKNERRSWVLRRALAGASCETLNDIETERPFDIYCEESGCWWIGTRTPTVTCAGDVATMKVADGRTITRDCSHAYQKCSTTSETGCTDRAPVACDGLGKDRCDGAIKLGCDRSSRVSFRDCTRVAGGTCMENADGSAQCVYPDAKKCSVPSASTCSVDSTKVSVCVAGEPQEVECTALGFTKCDSGRCV